jgi:hypothetical protein
MGPATTFILASIAIVLTFVWLGVHGVGLYLYLKKSKDAPSASKLSVVAWLISFGSGFTGPLVILGNLASLLVAVIALVRTRGKTDASATLIAAWTTIIASLVIELMGSLLIGWIVVWTYLMH